MDKIKPSLNEINDLILLETGSVPSGISSIERGEWSKAYAFWQESNKVIRFGQYDEDYRKDAFAMRFAAPNLPVPRILQIGEAFGGYFAISEKAPGIAIDDLNVEQMQRIVPALIDLLDALRDADISETIGYGGWGADGNALSDSWGDYLLDIVSDRPDARMTGWRERLADSSIGMDRFNLIVDKLAKLTQFTPTERHLIHSDLLHFNLLMDADRVSAVIDWGCAKYGDFLYDLAWFTFWAPWHDAMQGIDWRALALEHYTEIGLEVPNFNQRLRACELHIGLDSVIYCANTGRWDQAEKVMRQMEGS